MTLSLYKLSKILQNLNKFIFSSKCYCSNQINSDLKNVRVRFAPSPTGKMHLGSVRTAFVNYLFAKKYDGKFILRIEDTDKKRVVPGAIENIQNTLEWFSFYPDEGPFNDGSFGPYLQSDRIYFYQKAADYLLKNNFAYRCFCDETILKLLKDQALKTRSVIGYDNRCRFLTEKQIEENLSQKKPFCIRFKLPDQKIFFNDIIMGEREINLMESEPDFVILKKDSFPTYHLANIVDDHLMNISHVFRGKEWLKSVPKHLLLYNALNYKAPKFGHLPLIINLEGGGKLSKRNEDVTIEKLKNDGVFKESILNYLATIGGGFKSPLAKNNEKIFNLNELIEDFDENLLKKKLNKLDLKKIFFFNKLILKDLIINDSSNLISILREKIFEKYPNVDNELINDKKLIELLKYIDDTGFHLNKIIENFEYIWTDDINIDVNNINFSKPYLEKVLSDIPELFNNFQTKPNSDDFEKIKKYCIENDIKYGSFIQFFRFMITGKTSGLPIKDLYNVLSKETIKRKIDFFYKNFKISQIK